MRARRAAARADHVAIVVIARRALPALRAPEMKVPEVKALNWLLKAASRQRCKPNMARVRRVFRVARAGRMPGAVRVVRVRKARHAARVVRVRKVRRAVHAVRVRKVRRAVHAVPVRTVRHAVHGVPELKVKQEVPVAPAPEAKRAARAARGPRVVTFAVHVRRAPRPAIGRGLERPSNWLLRYCGCHTIPGRWTMNWPPSPA